MTCFALLDYDGFICKAYFAEKHGGAYRLLRDLTSSAIRKAKDFFGEEPRVVMAMSSHSWKKDLYPDFKISRKKDPGVKEFRDFVLAEHFDSITLIDGLEADEVVIAISDELTDRGFTKFVVFSDDKDLRYVSELNCKVNLDEQITQSLGTGDEMYEQMLAGDKEDSIKGLPKVGMKTAHKLLQEKGKANLESVIKIYKEKGLSPDECLKNIVLINPMRKIFTPASDRPAYSSFVSEVLENPAKNNDLGTYVAIRQYDYLQQQVSKIYNEGDEQYDK